MAIREIITVPHDNLKRKARKVTTFDKKLHHLFDDMVETMRVAPGVGLAGPQIDILQRVIVVEYGKDEDPEAPKKLYMVANPELKKTSEEMEWGVEGCLSIPGFLGEVERHVAVTVVGQNKFGQPMKIKADGWLARIFQHEIDHLDGILFPDIADRIFKLDENGEVIDPEEADLEDA